MTRRGKRTAAALRVALALWATVAAAKDAKDGSSAAVEFAGSPGCPDAEYFARRVASRRSRGDALASGAGLIVRAEVTRTSRGAIGRLTFVEPGRAASERTVVAADCREVTDALALIVAIALDRRPSSGTGDVADHGAVPGSPPPGSTNASPAVTAPAPATAAASPSTGVAAAASNETPAFDRAARPAGEGATPPGPWPAPTAPASDAGTEGPRPSSSSAPGRGRAARGAAPSAEDGGGVPWSLEATAAALLAFGMAPAPTVGVGGWLALDRRLPGALHEATLRVGAFDLFGRSFDRALRSGSAVASFEVLFGAAELCPMTLRIVGRTSVRPCAVGEYGRWRASSSKTVNPRPGNPPWAAAGAGATVSLPLAGPIGLELSVALLAAAKRERFVIGADDVFVVPPLVGRTALGLRIAWP